jgi:cation diffusion facilitator CzcD-associated flavoprotein CzcO
LIVKRFPALSDAANMATTNGIDSPEFHFQDQPVDQGRPINVVIIGAGVSGIALYIRLLQYVPNASVTIFEKNPSVGGTWYENRYPGVACDIPSHVYQYTFEPNTDWSKLFAPGAEILEYVKGVAHKYGVDEKVKYNTKVVQTEWFEDEGLWQVTTEHTENGTTLSDQTKAHVVISAVGILNNWKWPEVDGLHDFEGKLLHSACWDTEW